MINFFKKYIKFRRSGKSYVLKIGNLKNDVYENFKGLEINFYPQKHHFVLKYEKAGYFDPRPEINFSLGWGWIFIHLPFKSKYDECDPPSYGVYYFENAFWFNLGRKVKSFDMPWAYEWVRTSVLLRNQTMEHETRGNRKDFYKEEWKKLIWYGNYTYNYTLKNGTVQERFAKVSVEEREWRQHWLHWTNKFAKIRKTINVEFSDEVGERTGSWKGGTVGCGYEMLPKESPLACLRRMEKERTF